MLVAPIVATGAVSGVVLSTVEGGGPTALSVLVAVASSSVVAAGVTAWNRRRSGEGPAKAALDITEAAGELAMIGTHEALRLQQRVVDISLELAEATRVAAQARIEVHELKSARAALLAQVESLRLELETERVRHGALPGRREDD